MQSRDVAKILGLSAALGVIGLCAVLASAGDAEAKGPKTDGRGNPLNDGDQPNPTPAPVPGDLPY